MAAESLHSSASEQCLDDVVVAYLKSLQAGQTPDPEEWLGRYPELAVELREFFADQAAVRRWTAPLRPLAAATPPPAGTDTPLPGAARGVQAMAKSASRKSSEELIAAAKVRHLRALERLRGLLGEDFVEEHSWTAFGGKG
jgi:hypothetical protein